MKRMWWLVALATMVGFVGGCDALSGGKSSSSKAKKDKSDDDDDDDKKKKKKKKKSDDDEEEEGDEKAAGTATPTVPNGAPATGVQFAGVYRSTWGDAAFRQTGNAVTATYPGGTLDCIATDADLDCSWKDSAGVGKAKLKKLPDNNIDGTWGMGASATGGGRWLFTLLRAGDPGPTGTEAAVGSFAGVYVSTWGDTTFVEAGSTVTGRYPSGTLTCVATGAALDCDWREGSLVGKAKLTRQLNGDISGTWGNGASATNGGSWLFRKK